MTMLIKNRNRQITFEDLRGLRAEGYVRDSDPDQKNGFGPDIQRHNEERFAQSYGLILGTRWYTEFVTGTSVKKRYEFQSFIQDARLGQFDVLLVDHTSRFGRNQTECRKYKDELQSLGIIVVFVSQGIISGSNRDFLNERINETLDEQYSRNLSYYVSGGLRQKAEDGCHNGPPPLGYKSEVIKGQPERKVPNPMTMPALLTLLRDYATGLFSFREVAERLNSQGFRMNNGSLFTGYSIRDILANRFYERKIVYHQGFPDEKVSDGKHEVPDEVRDLWRRCQKIKKNRAITKVGHPRNESHDYTFSGVMKCHRCGYPYHGEAVYYRGHTILRMTHERRTLGRQCDVWPRSRSIDLIIQELSQKVLPHLHLDDGWKKLVVTALSGESSMVDTTQQIEKLEVALKNLRKQHQWGDISDDEYNREKASLNRQVNILTPRPQLINLPNLEREAQLLNDLPALWSHEGVTNKQREALVQEVFNTIENDGNTLVAIEPKPEYAPLFATVFIQNPVGYCDLDSPPSPPETQMSRLEARLRYGYWIPYGKPPPGRQV